MGAVARGIVCPGDLYRTLALFASWTNSLHSLRQRHQKYFGETAANGSVDGLRRNTGQIIPLLGLLGTILGMITTFQTFTANGNYVLASILADGMWQALISTAASLMIAIPIQFAHHFLTGRVRALVRDIEWSANEIMRYLLQEYRNEGPAAEEVVTK